MPEEAPIEEQLSSVSITPPPSTKAPLTSLQDLEPPRRSAAAAATSHTKDGTTLTTNRSTTSTPSTDLTSTSPSPLPHRSHSPTNNLKRSDPFQFGSRYLEAGDDVFEWNAWDHVDPSKDELFVAYARRQFEFQREHRLSEFDRTRFNREPEKWWDKFYGNNGERFFKDRKWLRQEFPVLARCCAGPEPEPEAEAEANGERDAEGAKVRAEDQQPTTNTDLSTQENPSSPSIPAPITELKGPARPGGDWLPPPPPTDNNSTTPSSHRFNTILEIGAGAGNTAYPILAQNLNPSLLIHATQFSQRAIDLIRTNPAYDPTHIRAQVWDMASATQPLPAGVHPGSIDVVMLVFAFSALNPRQWAQAVRNVYAALRPGGEVCFRDYGRGDLAQVRFKKGRLLEENFYIRGDGTRVYFFEEEELRKIWGGRLREVLPGLEVRGESGSGEVDTTAGGGGGGGGDASVEDASKASDEAGRDSAKPAIDAGDDRHNQNDPTTDGNNNGDDEEGSGEQEAAAAKKIPKDARSAPAFDILALAADRRLLVNRGSRVKMYRCWMQGRFRKPFDGTGSGLGGGDGADDPGAGADAGAGADVATTA